MFSAASMNSPGCNDIPLTPLQISSAGAPILRGAWVRRSQHNMISEADQTRMGHQLMNSVPRRGPAVAATTIALLLALSARAGEPDIDRFKADIDAFIGRLSPSSNGVVKWAESDPYEIRRDGDKLLAIIENAHLSLETQQPGALVLDRIEIREIGRREQGELIELALALPKTMRLTEADGTETQITLRGARANTLVEPRSGRGRETVIEIESARIDQPKTGNWVSFGPLSMASKLVAESK